MTTTASSSFWEQGEDHSVEVNQRALIDKILARYSGEATIWRELIQNADDANAQSVKISFFTKEGLQQSDRSDKNLPDLLKVPIHKYVFENDGTPFRPEDWSRLRQIASGNPDEDKIGAFGVGFYSLFSCTEQPFIESPGDDAASTKWMGFYWKNGGDQLYARSGTRPSRIAGDAGHEENMTGNGWTRFTLDLRNPVPIEGPLDLARFLVQSLTFMNKIRRIRMCIDGWTVLDLTKEIGLADQQVDLKEFPKQRGAQGLVSPGKAMQVDGLFSTGVRISSKCMSWLQDVGFVREPLPSVLKPKPAAGGSGFASMLASVFTRSVTPSPSTNSTRTAVDPPKQDPRAILSNSMTLQIYRADVKVTLERALEKELERATKKLPPKRTSLQLIFSELDSQSSESGNDTVNGIFAGLKPETGGKIFIGQATGQTTGIGGHIAARFIPTVERESIDLMDRWVSVWNRELLYVAGFVSRTVYEIQMRRLGQMWPGTAALDSEDAAVKEVVDALLRQAEHTMKYFTFKPSTPSAQVAQTMEAAFYTSLGDKSIPIISTKGIRGAETVRLPHDMLNNFLPNLPIFAPQLETKVEMFVARLRERRLLREISLEDVIEQLSRNPLTETQMLACFDWWKQLANLPQYDESVRRRLLQAAVFISKDAETGSDRIVSVGALQTYLNPAMIPTEVPLPPHTAPYTFTKVLKANDMTTVFGWKELTIPVWIQSIDQKQVFTSEDTTDQVFGVLGRAWPRLSNGHKEEVKVLLADVTCIPTTLGFRKPGETYHKEVSLFEDLPIITFPHLVVRGSIRNMLDALGVRSVVDLQLIFTRLIGKSVWGVHDLARYLSSVRKSLSTHEFNRLKKTAAFPVWSVEGEATPVKRTTPDALCEPTLENKDLGVRCLDYGTEHVWKSTSAEALLLFELGLRRHPAASELLRLASSSNPSQQQKALKYLFKNIRQYPGFDAPAQAADIAFIPARTAAGAHILAKPTEVFINRRSAVIGCHTADGLTDEELGKLKLLQEPPTSVIVQFLTHTPPKTVPEGAAVFEYLTSRLLDLKRDGAIRYLTKPFIPTESGRLVLPSQAFFKPKDDRDETFQLYKNVYDFVDFGLGDTFLEVCGVKAQPTQEQVARMIVGDPYGAKGRLASNDKYIAQLRLLAANYHSLPIDLRRQMAKAPFLMALRKSKRSKQEGSATETDGDDQLQVEFTLASASDVAIVDDPYLARVFSEDFLSAPEETLLEDFYAQVGVKVLSSFVKEEYKAIGANKGITERAEGVRKHILERLALFLSDRKAISKRNIEWLKDGDNLQVIETENIQVKRSLKIQTTERTSIEAASAAHIKGSGNKLRIYISSRIELDLWEVSLTICNTLLSRTRNEDVLVLHTILESPLNVLRRRGYNIDRILNNQRNERLAREAEEKEKLALERKRLIEAANTSTRSTISETPSAVTSSEITSVDNSMVKHTPDGRTSSTVQQLKETDRQSIKSQGIMDQLKARFRQSADKSEESPLNRNTGSEVTPMSAIKEGAMRAVAASRPNASKADIISEPSERMVKESADTYCDNTGVKTNLIALGPIAGTSVQSYVDRDIPNGATVMSNYARESQRFAREILVPLAHVFKLEPTTLQIFYDAAGPLIAFNRNGSLFMNLRYYLAWHDGQVKAGARREAWTSWFLTMAHECAHNLVTTHDAQHEFFTSAIIETLMDQFVQLLANGR